MSFGRCCKLFFNSRLLSRRFHNDAFVIHPEVKAALSRGEPVVALETTIVTHGMPYPHNVDTAIEVEEIIRSESATPSTIAVLDGVVRVGLSTSELQHLATSPSVHKISRRDLAFSLARKWSGGTTVAGTMMCAHRAGIPVFVTGGIGGVHRGGENSMDISADLMELSRTPVGVVCAGIKSILDIGRTLEYLETQGVPVVAMDTEGAVPAFFTPRSGHRTPHKAESPREAAEVMDASLGYGVDSGVVITVPIPTEASCLGEEIEAAIQQALQEARSEDVRGKDVTPFVLKRVGEMTGGKSLEANISLIRNNARVGAQIARELSRLRQRSPRQPHEDTPPPREVGLGHVSSERRCTKTEDEDVPAKSWGGSGRKKGGTVVVGAAILDLTAKFLQSDILKGGTNPGLVSLSYGGVARNIAECMSRLGVPPLFLSAVGRDWSGELIRKNLSDCGLSVRGVCESVVERTASYCILLDHTGEFHTGIGDMDVNSSISVDWVKTFSTEMAAASCVCMDGNIPETTMRFILEHCRDNHTPVWFEPTCILKSTKPLGILRDLPGAIQVATPNLQELRSMHQYMSGEQPSSTSPADMTLKEKLEECSFLVQPIISQIPLLLVSLSQHGVLHCSSCNLPHPSGDFAHPSCVKPPSGKFSCTHYPAVAVEGPSTVLSVSGAGDSFVGGLLAGISRDLPFQAAVKGGLITASLSLQSASAISSQIDSTLVQPHTIQIRYPWTSSNL